MVRQKLWVCGRKLANTSGARKLSFKRSHLRREVQEGESSLSAPRGWKENQYKPLYDFHRIIIISIPKLEDIIGRRRNRIKAENES